ncbi:hypothetical protein HID58_006358, partial [Brassica napus]
THGYGYSERSPTLNDVKPFKDTWKVEIRVLHSWTQHSSYSGGDSFDFILPDKTGVKLHYTYKRNFFPLTPANGKYRPTNQKYKMSITGNSNVTNSELKIDDDFLTLTPLQAIMNGSLDSKKLVGNTHDIGRATDIGDLQVVQVIGKEKKKPELTLTDTNDQHIACCLWSHFSEDMHDVYRHEDPEDLPDVYFKFNENKLK